MTNPCWSSRKISVSPGGCRASQFGRTAQEGCQNAMPIQLNLAKKTVQELVEPLCRSSQAPVHNWSLLVLEAMSFIVNSLFFSDLRAKYAGVCAAQVQEATFRNSLVTESHDRMDRASRTRLVESGGARDDSPSWNLGRAKQGDSIRADGTNPQSRCQMRQGEDV